MWSRRRAARDKDDDDALVAQRASATPLDQLPAREVVLRRDDAATTTPDADNKATEKTSLSGLVTLFAPVVKAIVGGLGGTSAGGAAASQTTDAPASAL